MKIVHSITFTKEELEHVRAVCQMLDEIDNYDYKELCEQVRKEQPTAYDFRGDYLFNSLEALLNFVEKHVD